MVTILIIEGKKIFHNNDQSTKSQCKGHIRQWGQYEVMPTLKNRRNNPQTMLAGRKESLEKCDTTGPL